MGVDDDEFSALFGGSSSAAPRAGIHRAPSSAAAQPIAAGQRVGNKAGAALHGCAECCKAISEM